MRRKRTSSIAAAASTLCIGLSAGALPGEQPKPADGIDVQIPDSQDRVEGTWTRDRMRAAKPTPKPILNRETKQPVEPAPGPVEPE